MLRPARTHRWPRWLSAAPLPLALIGLAAVAVVAIPRDARAQASPPPQPAPLVSAIYTQGGGFFSYNFTIQNLGTTTLADISLAVPTGANSVTNLSAPTGFQSIFDPSLGFVDFLADNDPNTPQDFFGGTSVSGFLFRSPTLLTGARFDALDENGAATNGTIRLSASAAPEPGTLGLLAAAGIPLAALVRRRFTSTRS